MYLSTHKKQLILETVFILSWYLAFQSLILNKLKKRKKKKRKPNSYKEIHKNISYIFAKIFLGHFSFRKWYEKVYCFRVLEA